MSGDQRQRMRARLASGWVAFWLGEPSGLAGCLIVAVCLLGAVAAIAWPVVSAVVGGLLLGAGTAGVWRVRRRPVRNTGEMPEGRAATERERETDRGRWAA